MGLALALSEEKQEQLKGLLLIYPVLGADIDTPSYIRNAKAPSLNRNEMIFYLDSFLGAKGGRNWRDPKAVPNFASLDQLKALPRCVITVAAHDPLRDDGVIFAEKLKAAGVVISVREEPELVHSYMRARNVSVPSKKGFEYIIEALRSLSHG